MANSTLKGALAIHGGNPQFLIEKVIRARIYDSIYWKEQCFALTAETIIDKAIELNSIGGVYGGNQRPTEFLSLALKLLVLQPEKAILVEYLKAEEFKYLRALTAFYIRLTFRSIDVYETLEPLLSDYRKLRVRNVSGYALTYMDEFIDDLLTQERVCDVILPRLTKREVLEDTEGLKKRKSTLEMAMNGEDDRGSMSPQRPKRARSTSQSPGYQSRSPSRSPRSPRYMSRSPSRSLSRSPDRQHIRRNSQSPYRNRMPSRTPSDAYASEGELDDGYRSRSPSISPDRDLS